MVDRALAARKAAAIPDAVQRVAEVLPPDLDAFLADRTGREVVALNLFVAIRESVDLAFHTVADQGWGVPENDASAFALLADRLVIPVDLGRRLAQAAGFRNLVAHRYGVIDWTRVYATAREDLDDLGAFCAAVARHVGTGDPAR